MSENDTRNWHKAQRAREASHNRRKRAKRAKRFHNSTTDRERAALLYIAANLNLNSNGKGSK